MRAGRPPYWALRARGIGDLIELDPGKSAVHWLVKLKKVLERALRVRDRGDDAQIGPHGLIVSIGSCSGARVIPHVAA